MNSITLNLRGRRSAIATFNKGIWDKLSPADRTQAQHIICNTRYGSPDVNGRSRVYALQQPVSTDGHVILSLRFKGIAPNIMEDGTIPRHSGDGHVPNPIIVDEKGIFSLKKDDGYPEGGIKARDSDNEHSLAEDYYSNVTDLPFCFGAYPEYRYCGNKLGFVGLAMESKKDLRLWKNFVVPRAEEYKQGNTTAFHDEKLLTIAYMWGIILSHYHTGHVHRYLHLGNIGIIPKNGNPTRVVLRDLDASLPLGDMTPIQRYNYLGSDLLRVFKELFEARYRRKTDGVNLLRFNLAHLFPLFLQGYLGHEIGFLFNDNAYNSHLTPEGERNGLWYLWVLRSNIEEGKPVNLYQSFRSSLCGFFPLMHRRLSVLSGIPV